MAINFNKVEFILSAASEKQFVRDGMPQLAFAGRSNVGKSSVINRLVNRKNFARVGASPGKTSQINYFKIDGKLYLVDLPGYGYAKVSKTERDRWGKLMEHYFQSAGLIHLGVQIVDARHKPTADDVTMHDYFVQTGCPVVIVANKLDKLKAREIEPNLAQIRETLSLRDDELVIPFSAEKGTGKEQLSFACPLLCRKRNERVALAELQRLADEGEIRLDLAGLELIELVRDDDERTARLAEPIAHRHVVRRRLVPRVDDLHTEVNEPRRLEIALHQLAPAVALVLADLCVAVAGQIREVDLSVDEEVVDLRGLAGRRADAGEVVPVQQTVDDRGLADVRASGKGHLRPAVADERALPDGGENELRAVKVDRHGAPPDTPEWAAPSYARRRQRPRAAAAPLQTRRRPSRPGQNAAPRARSGRSPRDP